MGITITGGVTFGSGISLLTPAVQDPYWANVELLLSSTTATNNTFVDSSTNNFTITVGGNTVTNSSNPYALPNNYGSISFDGNNDYLLSPTSAALDFGTGNFTIETWVNFSALSSHRVILDRWTSGLAGGWQLYWRATGTSLTFFAGNAIVVQDPSTTNIVTNTWYHVAVTRSSGTVRLFLNGTSVASAANSTSLNSTLPLAVGIQYTTLTNDFLGGVTDVRITNGIARYTSNFTPPTAPFPTS